MKKSIKYYLTSLLLCLIPFVSMAENTPDWEYDPYSFQYDLSMYISIYQKGVEVQQWDNLVLGAFCGNECRGIATVNQVPDGLRYYYLRVKSNSSQGEEISFRCFDKQANKEINLEQTIVFENLKMLGYPSDPYILNLPFTSVTGVTLNKSQLTLITTNTETLSATIAPTDATNKNVHWSSNNETIATVSTAGLVTAIKAGTAIITATTEDGNYSATCNVTVVQLPTGIYLNKTELTLNVTEEETLEVIVEPEDAQYILKWSSLDETVATVDQTGKVTAIAKGTSIITVTTEDGEFTASCKVEVISPENLDFTKRAQIAVFPAKMKDSYYIQNAPTGVIINIIDLNGITVKILKSTGESIQLMSLNNLSPGIYFVHVKSKNNFVKKILIE